MKRRTLDPVPQAAPAASESAASSDSLPASGSGDSRRASSRRFGTTSRRARGAGSARTRSSEDGQLFDRGYLDSFSYVEFLAFIEETYRVRIDDSQLAGHLSTIAAMADHILREQTAPASEVPRGARSEPATREHAGGR